MSGLPILARGQKYQLLCGQCKRNEFVRGTTQLLEPEELGTWVATDQITEYECQRPTCKAVSYLVVRVTLEGVFMWWRDQRQDGVRTVIA